MTDIYKLSDNPHIVTQIPYKFSRWSDAQNASFAFFAKTVLADQTIIDIVSAAGTDIDYLGEYIYTFYGSSIGDAIKNELSLDPKEVTYGKLRAMSQEGDSNLDILVAKFINPLLYTIRSIVNDMLYSIIISVEKLSEITSTGQRVQDQFIKASRSGDRVSKSIRQALIYLATVMDGVTVNDDGIELNAELKPLLISLMRTYAHTLLVTGRTSWLDREVSTQSSLLSVNSVTHTLLAVIDENSYKKEERDDETIAADIVIVEKFLCLLSGEDPEIVSELMKKLAKLCISNIQMANGIHKALIKGDVGIEQASITSGKKLKRSTPKMKSLYQNEETRDSVLRKIVKRELPQKVRASIERVGDGDLYVMIDVSGSTVDSYGSTTGVFILFEAMGIAIVNAARAAKKDCTIMFYGDAVTYQVDFKSEDSEIGHRRKMTELTNQIGPHGNDEMLSLQWAFEQVRRRNGKKPTTIMLITDGGVLTQYGTGQDSVNQFKLELGLLKSDVNTTITILPIIVNPRLDDNFKKAFIGTEFVHIKQEADLTPKVLTDIMRYVVTLDADGNESIDIVPK